MVIYIILGNGGGLFDCGCTPKKQCDTNFDKKIFIDLLT